ncbi:hypothetical protein [Streptomyces sp. 891-h]|uniref:hypothetical protein n=1 Tax=Streptomyces sp. 891-h TaxID=2720714 RepID=UPI001FA9EDE5|nr:hypothetical protein [Streptomyces sp. 891-h]
MFLIEIACPRGALADDDRRDLAADVCQVLVGAEEGVAEETMSRARAAMGHAHGAGGVAR